MWILLLILSSNGPQCNNISEAIEFKSQDACEEVRKEIKSDIRAPFMYAECFKQGE